jgi:hypothetical protein
VTYAFGEGKVCDSHAFVGVTEDGTATKASIRFRSHVTRSGRGSPALSRRSYCHARQDHPQPQPAHDRPLLRRPPKPPERARSTGARVSLCDPRQGANFASLAPRRI